MKSRLFLAIALLLSTNPFALSQVATGTPPFSSVTGWPDSINLGNLNMQFCVPVFSKPGRGIPLNYSLCFDNSVWYPAGVSGSQSWQAIPNWGWRGSSESVLGYVDHSVQTAHCIDPDTGFLVFYSRYIFKSFHDGFGAAHPVTAIFVEDSICGPAEYDPGTTNDGTAYTITPLGYSDTQIVDRSGNQIPHGAIGVGYGSGTLIDTNGNELTATNGTFTDTLGQAALTASGGAPNNLVFTYHDSSGAPQTVTVSYLPQTVKTNFGCGGISEYGPTQISLVDKITFPDSSYYQFTYEPTPGFPGDFTGRVASIRLRTGGTIQYTYSGGSDGIVCADGSTAGLTRQAPDGTTNYSRSNVSGTQWSTTIQSPLSDKTVVNFQQSNNNFYETSRYIYQGQSALLQVLYSCYNGSSPSCDSTAVALPITEKSVYDTIGSHESRVDTFYNGSFTGSGLASEVDEYDLVSGSWSPLRKTITGYASLGNNIFDRPSSVTVQDGGGTTKALTNFYYDQPGTLTSTSGVPQHTAISGSRGNLTEISQWVDTTGGYLNTNLTYDDTGNVLTETYPNNSSLSFQYGQCASGFLTSTTEQPLNLSSSASWDCTGGVMISTTDENGKTTSYAHDDPLWRLSSATDSLSNVTNFSYTSTSTEQVLNFNSGGSTADVLTTIDSLGRPMLSQIRQSPGASSFDSVQNTYDALARPSKATLPYVGTSGQGNSGAPSASTSYDPLNRITQQTDAAGGYTSYSYSGRDVLITVGPAPAGENTKRRQLEFDALGRLTSVCEITSAAGSGTCGQDSPQTGYWTKYSYDVLDHLTAVTQNAQGSSQSRSYNYDSISRMTSQNTPESGTVTYIYDSVNLGGCQMNNPGDLVMTTDAAGNGSCYGNDSLHRVKSIGQSYGGSPNASVTPDKCFNYDAATVNGVTMSNTKGRLAEAYTVAQGTGCGAAKITDEGFSYSPRGELTDIYESTPHSGGYYHVSQSYWANGAVNTIGGLGLAALTYAVDGEGRNSTVSASSGQSPVTLTSYNTAGSPTALTFGSGDSDSFSYDGNTNRMTQYKFTVGSSTQSIVGGLTWNAIGTLAKLTISDPFNSTNQQTCLYSSDDLSRISGVDCGSAPVENYASPQSSGNFGVYNQVGTALWTTGTTQSSPAQQFPGWYEMTMQDDGNAVLYHPMWANWASQSAVTGAFPTPSCPSMGAMLYSGQQLTVGKCLVSANGRFYLVMQSDGNLVEYDLGTNPQTARWWSGTYGQTVSYATMQSDGNFVLYGPPGNAVWNTGTWLANPDPQYTGFYLMELQNDGNAVIYHPLWASNTAQGSAAGPFAIPDCDNLGWQLSSGESLPFGECLVSPAGRFELKMQADGNFVLYDLAQSPKMALWSTGTTSAGSVVWSQSFNYDPFGNISKSGTGAYQPTYSPATNRMTSLPGSTPSYDANGNVTNDSAHTYAWDAAGNLIGIDSITKTFDALGRLVEINRGGSYQQVAYSPTGGKLAIMAGQSIVRAYVPLPAGATAVYGSGGTLSYYRHPDWLGSSRFASTPSRTMYYDGAYAPFGEAYAELGTTDRSFTGQNQDTVIGLNDFLYREHSPAQGRWLSPDPYMGSMDLTNPQSLNRYTYVNNNPLSFTDSTGLVCDEDCHWDNYFSHWVGSGNCTLNGISTSCGFALGFVNNGSACIGSCSTSVPGFNGYHAVQTAGPTVYTGPNGEELSDNSIAELGLPPLLGLGFGSGLSPFANGGAGGALSLSLDSDCGGVADRTIHYSLHNSDGSRAYGYAVVQFESLASRAGPSLFGPGSSYQGAGEFTDSIRVGLGQAATNSIQTFFAAPILGNGKYGSRIPLLVSPNQNPTRYRAPWAAIGVYINPTSVFVQGTKGGGQLAKCNSGF